jgi:two-component SAPR family response regulator
MGKFAFVIDDDEVCRFTIGVHLKRFMLFENIFYFSGAREALEDLIYRIDNKITLPDVIFLDINMPYMNGWELLKEIDDYQELKEKTAIFIVTSSDDEHDKSMAKIYNLVSGYIIKPINEDLLKEKLQLHGIYRY